MSDMVIVELIFMLLMIMMEFMVTKITSPVH